MSCAGEILTKEFEELYEASELGEELVGDCDGDTLDEFTLVRMDCVTCEAKPLSKPGSCMRCTEHAASRDSSIPSCGVD